MCLVLGAFPCVPVLWVLFVNVVNLAVGIGLMSSAGHLDTFLGLVLPHGLLELTAVFVDAGTGLLLGRPRHNGAATRSAWPSAWRWCCSSPASSRPS